MCKKLIFLTSFVLVLALAGTNVALGDVWEAPITQHSDNQEELDPQGTPEGGNSGDLEMPYEDAGMGELQLVGIRWENVDVPKGVKILDAWIEFAVDETGEGTTHVSLIIEGELNPNPPTFPTTTPGEIAARQQTCPSAGYHSVTLATGEHSTGNDFGNYWPYGSISGVKFEDLNGNGLRDEAEQGLEGWTIYLDADNDGVLDPSETSTTTDANGSYIFTELDASTYTVREVVQDK